MRPPGPLLRLGGRRVRAFHASGVAGTVAGLAVVLLLARAEPAATVPVVLAISALAVLTFLALAVATKVVLGRERLVYYQHEILVLAVAAAVLAAWGKPVHAHLDLLALGVGTFLVIGRLGCLCAGCCYGRPAARGVDYGEPHVHEGFPAHLAGVRLLPVQAIEAAGAAVLVAAAIAVAVASDAEGAALATYLVGYGLLRFHLEPLRGDALRPYRLGLSAAQWTSLAQLASVAGLALAGELPGAVPALAALAVVAAEAVAAIARRDDPVRRLRAAAHLDEVAQLAAGAGEAPSSRQPARLQTSQGLVVTWTRPSPDVVHLGLSHGGRPLPDPAAEAIAAPVARLLGADGEVVVVPGGGAATHVLARAD